MFYLFLAAHLVADFVLQPYWLVQRKRQWDGLLIHGAVVLVCMLLLVPVEPALGALWPVMLVITMVHIGADYLKVHLIDHWLRPAVIPFLLDQVIHVATIGVALSITLPIEMVWTTAGSPAAGAALYSTIYLIGAFAAPIGVMVWLDPTFAHATLAGGARVRSFIAAAAVISLALFGGGLALPVTLAGLALIAWRPVSVHPLDCPAGVLMVLIIAASLVTALTMVV